VDFFDDCDEHSVHTLTLNLLPCLIITEQVKRILKVRGEVYVSAFCYFHLPLLDKLEVMR